MTKVVFSPDALEELKNIVRYTKKNWGTTQAVSYVSGLKKQTQILAKMPNLGKFYSPYKDQGVRLYPFEKHLIYYRVESFGITVLHVTHKVMDQARHISDGGSV